MRMFTPPSGIPQPVTNLEYKIMKRCTEGKLCKTDLSERDTCISQELVNRGIFEKDTIILTKGITNGSNYRLRPQTPCDN